MSAGPLQGIRVLDFSIIYAGPYAGMHLADLGAQVTKVEQPGGDPFRHTAAVIPENSKVFQYLNRGKRSIVANLQSEQGREVIHRIGRPTHVRSARKCALQTENRSWLGTHSLRRLLVWVD